MVTEITDCCATTLHVGLSVAGKAAFDKKPPPELGCGPVMPSCVVRWMRAESCETGSPTEIVLSCDVPAAGGPGQCMTRVVR